MNTELSTGKLLLLWIQEYCGTVADFAQDIGIPATTIRHWINDRCSIRPVKLAIVAEYFADEMQRDPQEIYVQLILADQHIRQVTKHWNNKQGDQ